MRKKAAAAKKHGGSASIEQDSPTIQITRIREGVPAREVISLAAELGLTKSHLYKALGYPRSTVDRQISSNKRLSPEHTERFLAARSLVELVERIVDESGDPEGFNAAAWLGQWLEQPQSALAGQRPGDFLDTYVGIEFVRNLLLRAQTGAYS